MRVFWHKCFLATLVSLLLGLLFVSWIQRDDWPEIRGGTQISLTGRVVESLGQDGAQQTMRMRAETFEEELPGFVQVTTGAYPALVAGDVIEMTCDLKPIRDVYAEDFRYDRYLAKERVYALCYSYGPPQLIGHHATLRSNLLRFRDRIGTHIQGHLHEPHASFLIGLLYGARSTLPEDTQEVFRRTGTMHIIAVSGYNVLLVSSLVMGILTLFWFRRQRAFGFVIFAIVAYVLLTGADAAVVRAGIMGSIVLLLKHIGRISSPWTLLLIAATTMALENPRILLDDAGFHLSFSAVAGLVVLGKRLENFFPFLPKSTRTALSETLAATIATAPIMLLQFNQFSLVSPIANLIVVPLIPVATGLGAAGTLVGLWSEAMHLPAVADIVLLPAAFVLDTMLRTVNTLAPLPYIDFS